MNFKIYTTEIIKVLHELRTWPLDKFTIILLIAAIVLLALYKP